MAYKMYWDYSHETHGNMWGCEKCQTHFCSKCFIDRHGADAFRRMMQDCDKILCPSCWEDKT